tara:strand:+ start:878 stop:1975 length:1098 start_codon:yes stop_codon:yes gene_type:complete
MNPNDKIQLDDITFDDVIAGDGLSVPSPVEELELPVEKEETTSELEDITEEVEEQEEVEVEEKEVKEKIAAKDEVSDDVEQEESEDSTVVSEVLSKLGYDVDNEYEDTSDGLVEMTKDVASQMADDRIDEVLEAFPLVKKHLEYVLAGGDSQNFMSVYDPNLDYNTMDLAQDDTRSQKAILSDYFSQKGHDKTFITEMLGDYEDSGKLHAKAEQAKNALGKVQASQKEQLLVSQKQKIAEQQKEQQGFWDNVSNTIQDSKEFAGLQVPEKEKSKFFNYLSKPVDKNGYTQRDVDHSQADMEVKLAIDYLMYKGFNLHEIINTKAKTKATKSLRDKISRNEEGVKSARKATRRSKNVDLDNLDLNI